MLKSVPKNRSNFVWLLSGFVLLFLVEKLLKHFEVFRSAYRAAVYLPVQRARVLLFKDVNFSIGDALYLMLLLTTTVALVRLLVEIYKTIKHKASTQLFHEAFRLGRWALIIYAVFVLGWGVNYTRPPLLYSYYKDEIVKKPDQHSSPIAYNWSEAALINVLDTLQQALLKDVALLQATAAYAVPVVNKQAEALVGALSRTSGLTSQLKVSSLKQYLQKFGIQGYFTPFSGEAHYTGDLFYLHRPFVFVHEMAHQYGIASETDANFWAYVLCINSQNLVFKRSAQFNLFLYVLSDLKRMNPEAYKNYTTTQIAPAIAQVLAALEAHRAMYKSPLRRYSMGFYDYFLKFFGQNAGLKSYNMMTYKVMIYHKNKLSLESVLQND